MQDTARTLDLLTGLIAVNIKRKKFYLSLAEKTDQGELKPLFNHYADQSRQFISSLSTWRSAYGGFSIIDKVTGTNSPWIQIRSLLDLGLRKNMLLQCEDMERDVLRIYKSAINSSCLPAATSTDVQQQCREIEKSCAKVRLLRERPAAAREVFART